MNSLPVSLPKEPMSTSTCNVFATFFNDKIQGFKNGITSATQTSPKQPFRHGELTHVTPVPEKHYYIICGLSSLLPQLTHLGNTSLQSGTLPKPLKTAVIKPPLK